jgi:hypothetical protein
MVTKAGLTHLDCETRDIGACPIVDYWRECFVNTKWAIFQLFHGEKKSYGNEMMLMSVLWFIDK